MTNASIGLGKLLRDAERTATALRVANQEYEQAVVARGALPYSDPICDALEQAQGEYTDVHLALARVCARALIELSAPKPTLPGHD